jgi:cell division protein FtsW (lipid II flippase)
MKLFPIVHLLALIIGGIILLFVKRKYRKVRNAELMIAFILLFLLVAIFTEPGLDLIKRMISLIQVE